MKIGSAILVGLLFGVAGIGYPLLQVFLGHYSSPYVQPLVSIAVVLVVGVISQLLSRAYRRKSEGIVGWLWLLIFIFTAGIVSACNSFARYLLWREHFFVEMQFIGLAIGLATAFVGYGLSWLVSSATGGDSKEHFRPRG